MYKIVLALVLMLSGTICAQAPNYVKSTTFNVGQGQNLVTTTFTDGLGRELQTKVSLNDGKDLVTCTFYDNVGRQKYVTKPFIDAVSPGTYLDHTFEELSGEDGLLYNQYTHLANGGNPFAYSENEYYSDPLGRVKAVGAPGLEYSLNQDHHSRTWYLSVSTVDKTVNVNGTDIVFTKGFIKTPMTGVLLDALYELFLSDNPFYNEQSSSNPTHFLTINKNPDGQFSQELKDAAGNVVSTWSEPSPAEGDEIISEYQYDALNQVTVEKAPQSEGEKVIDNTTYVYNTLGQVIRKKTPDGCTLEMSYNSTGDMKKTVYWHEKEGVRTTVRENVYCYDKFGRIEIIKSNGKEVQLNFYDNVQSLVNMGMLGIPAGYIDKLRNLRGRLVASVAVNHIKGIRYYVTDLFGYDEEGNVEVKIKIIPGLPSPQVTTYDYDIHGRKTCEVFQCGSEKIEKIYNYDDFGRLTNVDQVLPDGVNKTLVTYEYDELGQMMKKYLGNRDDLPVEYSYNIRDWLETISSPLGFSQNIFYSHPTNSDLTSYSGNIARSEYIYKTGTAEKTISQDYMYDNVNRLRQVSSEPEFSGTFDYDIIGRFTSKVEGAVSVTGYNHYGKTNRLKSVDVSNGGEISNKEFMYDVHGNMVLDREKKMAVEYDWRDMPIRFLFFEGIPGHDIITVDNETGSYKILDPTAETENIVEYLENEAGKADSPANLLSTVTMLYDAGGNRVIKISDR